MKTISLFLSLLTAGSLLAQGNFTPLKQTDDFKKKVMAVSDATRTIESGFTQTKHLSFVEDEIVSKGVFFYQKENKVRWEYQTPFPYLVVINGEKVMIKDDQKKQKIDSKSNKIFRQINDMIMSCVHGNIMESKDFSYALAENTTQYQLTLKPNAAQLKEFISQIDIIFNKSDNTVDTFTLREQSEDYTTIKFENKKLNGQISADKFIAN